jgi:15-cis-phytoene synthase
MRGGSKSFFAASLVLPRRVREPARALYAFCRLADDLIDTPGAAANASAQLHERLRRAYAGRPWDHPADRAFAQVVARYAIPQALPIALLEGFEWDARGRRYETIDALHDYAARVAGAVGAMMALVMGVRDARALARACELGGAMQLTNIARDVGEDARAGRVYLPLAWLREAGVDLDAWLAAPAFTPAIARVVQRLLDAADVLYERAESGIATLPRDCRLAIMTARLVYAEIGREVERRALDSVSQRAVVGTGRKLALVARSAALLPALRARDDALEPLAAIRFLVDAVPHRIERAAEHDRTFDARTERVVGIFERLAQRDRREYAAGGE